MKEQIFITDSKNFKIEVTAEERTLRKGQIYRKGSESFMVEFIITETSDHEIITTAFVKHVPLIGVIPFP